MPFVILLSSVPGILIGKYLFKSWMNHISLYTFIWTFMIFFHQLDYIKYDKIQFITWLYIALGYITLILGSLTYFALPNKIRTYRKGKNPFSINKLFVDKGKLIRQTFLAFTIIGMFSALQHWYVLLKMYGSIPAILLNGQEIYRMRVEGTMVGVIPYIQSFSFVAIFFAGIYSGYKQRISLLAIFPLLAIILKELANFSRAGILFGFVLFILTFVITYKYFKYKHTDRLRNKSAVLAYILIIALLISSAMFIRAFRGTVESFSGTSRSLSGMSSNLIISPSIYLYMSSHIGVFNAYMELDSDKDEIIGKNIFLPFYHILNKLGLVEHISQYQKGYYIPVWTNTGTYLREFHSDFGIVGILIIPYLLGFFTTKYWFRFYKLGESFQLIILVYLFTIIFFSFLVMITRLAVWGISLALVTISISLISLYFDENLTEQGF